MQTSTLKAADMRSMLKIGGELARLRDAPPVVSCGHYLERVCRLLDAHAGFVTMVEHQPEGSWRYLLAIPFSWEANYVEFLRETYIGNEVYLRSPVEQNCFELPSVVTCLRSRIIDDFSWRSHPFLVSLQRGAQLCDVLACKATTNKELNVAVVLFRHVDKGYFSKVELEAIELLHSALEWFFQKVHSELFSDQSTSNKLVESGSLSKRQIETLEHLLEGLTDKEIASRMGLSVTTVRQYVRGVFRVFGVQSRCELLAAWLRKYRDQAEPSSAAI